MTFVRPAIGGTRAFDAMEPLAFALLAAETPAGVELELFDERLEEVPIDRPTDLVALTIETYTARRAYQLARAFRRRGVPVVAGGYHPTFLPEEALAHVDAVVLGDAEGLWPRLLADFAAGNLQSRYRQSGQPSLAGLRFDRRVFAGKRYQPVLPVQYGRGCRYACDFCSIHAFYGTSVRQRPVGEVVDEIRAAGRRFVLLVDDNLFVDAEKARELFAALLPLGVRWGCQVSIDVARDPALLAAMAESGCIAALVGFESLDDGNLRQMKKRWNLLGGDYSQAVARFAEHGIMVYGSFIFGYDEDDRCVFERTVEFALDSRLFLANLSALTPMPATRLYARLEREGRLLSDPWWLDPGYRYGDIVFEPARMSAAELAAGCNRARRAFYRYGSLWKRAWQWRANCRSPERLGIFLGANWLSRRELSTKVGRPLGGPELEEAA